MTPKTQIRADDTIEDRLNALNPDDLTVRDPAELRAIYDLVQTLADSERRMRAAVLAARAAGYSWGAIATSLGVSTQAAHQRFRPAE